MSEIRTFDSIVPAEFVENAVKEIREQVGDGKVLLALSGGVDSSVCAALISKAIGKQLTCVFVDHGLLRKYEKEEVCGVFGEDGPYDLNFVFVDARQRFYSKLAGVTDPEKKRKIIGEEFIRVFEEEAKKLGQVDYLAQGTIYPDIMESKTAAGKVIKSHHNVGGLPDFMDFKGLCEPVKFLFKEEVRAVGRELGLDEKYVSRQPFPGPGIGVRVVGEVTEERCEILRDADWIWREEMAKAGYDKICSQYFAVLTNMKTVGIAANDQGGERTFDYTVGLRAIKTTDFVTAKAVELPFEFLNMVATRITSEVDHVNRVMYDVTDKPPATVEME